MELRNLKTFVHVAQTGSFSKTAQLLQYAQSTITAHIDALEQELGVPLFIRHGKRFALSPEGQQMLDYAYRLLALESEASAHFTHGGEPAGVLRVGMLESISASSYAEFCASYLRSYPKVHLQVLIGTTLELMDKLEKGLLDLIITLDVPVLNPAFITLLRHPVTICFFAAAGSSLAQKSNLEMPDLLQEPFLLTERGCNYRRVFEDWLAIQNYTIKDVLEIGHTQILIDCVAQGLGVSLLPAFNLTQAVSSGQVCILQVPDCRIELQIQVLAAKKQWMSPAKQRFAELMEALIIKT